MSRQRFGRKGGESGHRSRGLPTCRAITVDVDLPIDDVVMGGAKLLHVTAFTRGRLIGSAILDAPLDPFPGSFLASALADRFGAMIQSTRLSAKAEEPDGIQPPLPSGAVVVCTRDRPEQLARCLASIAALADPISEMIVVDNSRDGVEGLCDLVEGSGYRYVHEPQAGLSRARNRGALKATAEVVLFTDDDVELHPRWAGALLACFSDPLVMVACGLVLPAALDTPSKLAFERFAGFSRGVKRIVFDGSVMTPFLAPSVGAGASMGMRRVFLQHLGGFPESLGTGLMTGSGEDHYAFYRVLSAGFRAVYEPAALSTHHHRESVSALRRQIRGYSLGAASWLAYSGVRDRDPGAFTSGAPRLARYFGVRAVRSVLGTRNSLPPGLARAELAGLAAAPRALLETRRTLSGRPQIEFPEPSRPPGWWLADVAEPPDDGVALDALPPLSVVIPTRGRREMVVRLLRALDDLPYPDDRVEVVVSIDGDLDASEAAIAAAGLRRPVRVLVLDAPFGSRELGNGAGYARNRGAELATGDVLLFLDDDVIPAGERLLLAHGAAHAAGPAAVAGPCPPAIWTTDGIFAQQVRNWGVDHARRHLTSERLTFTDVSTGNLSVHRGTFEELGGFASTMPRREDWELGFRLMVAGVPIRAAAASVQHDADLSLPNAIEDRRREGAGDLLFARAHPQAFAWLPLAWWDDMRPTTRRIVRAAFADPSRFDAALAGGVRTLRMLERCGMRREFVALLSGMNIVAYWSGVAAAVGGESAWYELRAEARDATADAPPLDLAVEGWTPPRVGAAADVGVLFDGRMLGPAPVRWGRLPWSLAHFKRAVASSFADDALRAEIRHAVGVE